MRQPFKPVLTLQAEIGDRAAELEAINQMYRGRFTPEAEQRYEQVLKTKRRLEARLREIEKFSKKNFNLGVAELLALGTQTSEVVS